MTNWHASPLSAAQLAARSGANLASLLRAVAGRVGPALANGPAMRLALLLALLPAAALAQTTGLTLQIQGQSSQTVSGSDCGATTQLTWSVGVTGVACSNLVLWATTGTCGSEPGTGDFQIANISRATWSSQPSGTETLAISDLPISDGTDGGSCGAATEVTINLCGALTYASYDCSYGSQDVEASETTIVYDALPPAVPTVNAVTSLDSGLRVGLTIDSDTTRVDVQYREQGTSTWLSGGSLSSGEGGLTLKGLTNDVVYEVRARAIDAAGNQSDFSEIKTGTPTATAGFWAAYKNGGGTETGGCTAGGAGGLLGGVLVLLGLVWRKR